MLRSMILIVRVWTSVPWARHQCPSCRSPITNAWIPTPSGWLTRPNSTDTLDRGRPPERGWEWPASARWMQRGTLTWRWYAKDPLSNHPSRVFSTDFRSQPGRPWARETCTGQETRPTTIVVRVRNTRTGDRVEIRPTERLMEMLGTLKPRIKTADAAEPGEHADDHAVEALARTIAALSDREILVVTRQENSRQAEK